MKQNRQFERITELVCITESKVRFSEVDSMAVVWHGNYVKYIEDGREAFGLQFGLGYFDVYKHSIMTPIVKLYIDYKRNVRYEEKLRIETRYINSSAAKIIFEYKIYRMSDNALAVKAQSTQVFIDENGELILTMPEFYAAWKKKWNIEYI